MRTITLQVNDNSALKTLKGLENKRFISIIENSELDTPSLPRAALSVSEFRNWVTDAESAPTVAFNLAKEKWASKRKRLQQLTK